MFKNVIGPCSVADPGCLIPDPGSLTFLSRIQIPDPGSGGGEKAPDPGSRIPDPTVHKNRYEK
jgi:hypothetical protein